MRSLPGRVSHPPALLEPSYHPKGRECTKAGGKDAVPAHRPLAARRKRLTALLHPIRRDVIRVRG